jgi:hypothetical protein
MQRTLFSFFLLLFVSGCLLKQNTKTSLYGTWRLYDVEPQLENSGGLSFSEQASLKQIVKDGNQLCFFEDGSYTELKGEGEYKTGKFGYSEGKNALQFVTNDKETTPVEAKLETNDKGRQVLSLLNGQQNLIFKFMKVSDAPKNVQDAPFYAGNNLWRIKPQAPENEEQQTNRLTNYMKHVALILKAAKEGKQDIVSFEFSQGPIKIYNGGIGIHPYEIVPESWKKTFYNDADAHSAYQLYERYLRTGSYKGAATGEWVEDDYNILLSMYAGLTEKSAKAKR